MYGHECIRCDDKADSRLASRWTAAVAGSRLSRYVGVQADQERVVVLRPRKSPDQREYSIHVSFTTTSEGGYQ
jgi:hypothetical protein